MMSRTSASSFILLILALLLSAPRAAHAAESYDNCTGFITSLPAAITSQGTWCMKADLTTAMSSGYAININTNNVTIDCNNFKLGGLQAGLGTQAIGIYAVNRLNATVRRCNIRGFNVGVYFFGSTASSSGGHAIEDNRFDGNTTYGMRVYGDGSVIQRNRVFDTGGSTIPGSPIGIEADFNVDVIDNTVANVFATSGTGNSAYGVYTVSNSNGTISGNRVRGLVKDGPGLAYGIYNYVSDRASVHNNDVVGPGDWGITCYTTNGSSRDNVVSGFATPIPNCTDSGSTIIP